MARAGYCSAAADAPCVRNRRPICTLYYTLEFHATELAPPRAPPIRTFARNKCRSWIRRILSVGHKLATFSRVAYVPLVYGNIELNINMQGGAVRRALGAGNRTIVRGEKAAGGERQ